MRAGLPVLAALLLTGPVPARACALHGGWSFDHGFGPVPHHFAEDWAPARPLAVPPDMAPPDMSPAARMEQQREMMLARYPALRPAGDAGATRLPAAPAHSRDR